jgi:predicted signal transduction protein with EAL and GGDEF domain
VVHHCTASIGVIVFQSNGVAQDELLKRADDTMYEAKELGRNLVHFYGEGAVSNRIDALVEPISGAKSGE